MTAVRDVLRRLEARGSEQTRKTWRRWGVPEPMFGVLYADLGRLRRELGRDQSLARALWESGNHDARSLAAMLAEPAVFDAAMLERWLAEAACGAQRMALVSNVAVESPAGLIVLPRWLDDAAEGTRAAGWNLVLHLAKGDTLADSFFAPLVARIEREIHAAPNDVREVMNRTLIAIGARSEGLARVASAAARRIGVVEVDHGDTYCVTPDAGAHIAKIRAQRDARAAAKGRANTTAKGAARKVATKSAAAKRASTTTATKRASTTTVTRKAAAKSAAGKRASTATAGKPASTTSAKKAAAKSAAAKRASTTTAGKPASTTSAKKAATGGASTTGASKKAASKSATKVATKKIAARAR